MRVYRVLVVDDSAFMRKFVSDIIEDDPFFTVVETARNGQEAVDAVKRLRPDAVTMDVEMPVMTGLDALLILMREIPLPVIMLSSSTQQGAAATIKALELGAFDFVAKPTGEVSFDFAQFRRALIRTLKAAVLQRNDGLAEKLSSGLHPPSPEVSSPQVSPSSRLARMPSEPVKAAEPEQKTELLVPVKSARRFLADKPSKIVAIGTSTGGPRALQSVLTQIPEQFPAPILVVQHMPPGFTKSLAQRLDTLCRIQVMEAEHGMEIQPGTAYIAPGGVHMTLAIENKRLKVQLNEEPPRNGHRPSVDVLFESLLEFTELDRTVVLMTGMGSDGAKGMKQLYDSGVHSTIAEAQESCVVYGMPRSAVELGCVSHTVPLARIAGHIIQCVSYSKEV